MRVHPRSVSEEQEYTRFLRTSTAAQEKTRYRTMGTVVVEDIRLCALVADQNLYVEVQVMVPPE